MKCPRCGRKGNKTFGGFCSRVHQKLSNAPKHIHLECASCGMPVVRLSSQVSEGGRVYCKRCPKNSGETHPRWKEGQYLNKAGYRLILHKGDYQLEHRLNWEIANKACLLPEAHGIVIIHHINMEKSDNRPENLTVLSNRIHGRVHRLIDAERYDEAKCILLQWLEQQAFWLVHSEHLEHFKRTPLEDILAGH